MTEAQIARARANLARLIRKVDSHEVAESQETDAPWPPHSAHLPHDVWQAYRKIPMIRARLNAFGVRP